MTVDEYRALTEGLRTGKGNKYHAERVGGHASKKEHKRAGELKLLERAGVIRNLKEQVPYTLIPTQKDASGVTLERSCRYIADFVYTDSTTGETVVEDTKGFRTAEYKIKRKLMLMVHGVRIREI